MMPIVENSRGDGKSFPWFAGLAGLAVGLTMLYFWPAWARWWPGGLYQEMLSYATVGWLQLEDISPLIYAKLVLIGFLLVFLHPGYGKLPIVAWMLHNQPSGGTFFSWILRAWGLKCGMLVLLFCNLFFLRYVPSSALNLYSTFIYYASILASIAVGVLLVRDAWRLAQSPDAPLSNLGQSVVLTLSFQLTWPAQFTLISARDSDLMPVGWCITAALMVGVLLAMLVTAGLAWGVRGMLGDENCRAWRGRFALFNGIVILCAAGWLAFIAVSRLLE